MLPLPLTLLLVLGFGNLAVAQAPPAAEAVSPHSPRAALQRFFEASNKGRYADAAALLDVPPTRVKEAPELARKLRVVIERQLWIDFDAIAATADGDLDDGLPRGIEELGRIADGAGVAVPVRLIRLSAGEPRRWLFSRGTVGRIDGWYNALPDRRLMEFLPPPLLQVGPLDVMWWQWLALPFLVSVCGVLGTALGWLSRKALLSATKHRAAEWSHALARRARGPLTVCWSIAVGYGCLPRLGLSSPAQQVAYAGLKSGLVVALFWAVLRAIDVATDLLATSDSVQSPTARAMLPVGARLAKVAVVAMLVIAVLSNFGLHVASLLAGLGVGGVALALAAQKTVENLFGAVSIGVDRPFRIGDLVKIGDVTGHVERIGLRSTRIRTLDRTLVTLPNGGLADSRVESLTARDRIRLWTVVALEYGTGEATLRTVLGEIEALLKRDARVFDESIAVDFGELGKTSLNIDVSACLITQDFAVYRAWRQETLLAIVGIVERAGAKFAFPTQTVHLRGQPPTPRRLTEFQPTSPSLSMAVTAEGAEHADGS